MVSVNNVGLLGRIWQAIKQLNPETVKIESEQRFKLGLAGSSLEIDAMIAWLTQGEGVGIAGGMIERFDPAVLSALDRPARHCALVLCASSCSPEQMGLPGYRLHMWSASNPDQTVRSILNEDRLSNIHLPLAHYFKVFRKEMSARVIKLVSLENAGFVASTAIGNIIPNPLAPLASIAEAAGDVVVLTANQVRMLFRLAAANNKPVGYRELAPQIGSIIAAAFGWRALARELVGMVPLGGGLVAKSAVAYAGTWTVGEGIMYYFKTGRKMSREESKQRFQAVLGEARQIASQIANSAMQKVKMVGSR